MGWAWTGPWAQPHVRIYGPYCIMYICTSKNGPWGPRDRTAYCLPLENFTNLTTARRKLCL